MQHHMIYILSSKSHGLTKEKLSPTPQTSHISQTHARWVKISQQEFKFYHTKPHQLYKLE